MNISLQVQPALHPLVRRLLVLVEDVEYLGSKAKEGCHKVLFEMGGVRVERMQYRRWGGGN